MLAMLIVFRNSEVPMSWAVHCRVGEVRFVIVLEAPGEIARSLP